MFNPGLYWFVSVLTVASVSTTVTTHGVGPWMKFPAETGACVCVRTFSLIPFPAVREDQVGWQRWIKVVNRINSSLGQFSSTKVDGLQSFVSMYINLCQKRYWVMPELIPRIDRGNTKACIYQWMEEYRGLWKDTKLWPWEYQAIYILVYVWRIPNFELHTTHSPRESMPGGCKALKRS